MESYKFCFSFKSSSKTKENPTNHSPFFFAFTCLKMQDLQLKFSQETNKLITGENKKYIYFSVTESTSSSSRNTSTTSTNIYINIFLFTIKQTRKQNPFAIFFFFFFAIYFPFFSNNNTTFHFIHLLQTLNIWRSQKIFTKEKKPRNDLPKLPY